MFTKFRFMRIIGFIFVWSVGATSTISSQNFSYKEFKVDTTHLSPFSIQKTLDGNLLLVCNQYCFFPNAIAIEGCPISDQLIKLDDNLDVVFRKDLFNGGSFPTQEWGELPNGNFFAFMKSNSNFSCGNIGVAGFGFSRFERYLIDSEANLLNHKIYNEECSISPLSYISTRDNEYLVFAGTQDQSFELDNRILFIDSSFQIRDSIVYDDLELSRLQVTHIKGDSLYGVYTSTQSGSLNLIAFDLNSTRYNQRVITSLGPGDNFYRISDFQRDTNNNCYVATSNDDIKVSKYNEIGELIWITTLPTDISSPSIKMQAIQHDRLAILSGFLNQVSNTVDCRIQILDNEGNEIYRKEYEIDTTNTRPVDFEFDENSVVILGEVNKENSIAPSTPKRTFVLLDKDYLSSTNYNSEPIDIQLYPNPTTGIVKINLTNFLNNVSLEIYDVSGKILKKIKITSDEIDVSELKSGVYLAVMKNKQNISKTSKIVKL